MAGRFNDDFSTKSHHFEQARARLSDCLIGHVVPHDRLRSRIISNDIVFTNPPAPPRNQDTTVPSTASSGASRSNYPSNEDEKATKLAEKKMKRHEQLRIGQSRFRQKQRAQKLQKEEEELHELHQSVQGLKLRRQALKLQGKSKPSRWSIVSEVLHLVDSSFQSAWCIADIEQMNTQVDIQRRLAFLQTALAPRVAMGNLDGCEALTEQLRRYRLYFGDPHFKVKRVEALAPGVMRATGTLGVTITDSSLQFVFPHLAKLEGDGDTKGKHRSQRERLLNKRLDCDWSMGFLFDEESGGVGRLELSIDLFASLRRVFGDLKDASRVLEQALITPEGAIGDLTDQGSRNIDC